MKKKFFLLILCMMYFSVYSQDEKDRPQVLIDNSIENISGFGGFMMEFSGINDDITVSTGGGGALLLNQKFFFGGYGLGSHSHTSLRDPFGGLQDMDLEFNHGGFWLGYIMQPNKLIHYNVSTKFGWGNIHLNDRNYPGETVLNDNIFTVTPQLEGEINISYWFRINASLGYRLVGGVDNDYFKPGKFSSPVVGISFLFGWFKKGLFVNSDRWMK